MVEIVVTLAWIYFIVFALLMLIIIWLTVILTNDHQGSWAVNFLYRWTFLRFEERPFSHSVGLMVT